MAEGEDVIKTHMRTILTLASDLEKLAVTADSACLKTDDTETRIIVAKGLETQSKAILKYIDAQKEIVGQERYNLLNPAVQQAQNRVGEVLKKYFP